MTTCNETTTKKNICERRLRACWLATAAFDAFVEFVYFAGAVVCVCVCAFFVNIFVSFKRNNNSGNSESLKCTRNDLLTML